MVLDAREGRSALQRGLGEEAVPGLNNGDARTPESPHPDH